MSETQTLGDIVAFIEKNAAGASPAPSLSEEICRENIQDDLDFKEMFLEVVADKTGYPKDILRLDMRLEADLGIDSIKRVEIFSAVKDENPWLPEIDPAQMSETQTLGDVVAFIEKNAAGASPAPSLSEGICREHIQGDLDLQEMKQAQIGRYVLKRVLAPHSGFALSGLKNANKICVVDDETGVADELVKLLKQSDIDASVVDELPDDCDGLIFLKGLQKIEGRQDAIDVNRKAFWAAKKMANRLSRSSGIFVTVQDTGGDFGLSGQSGHRAWSGGLSGLVKTAAIEWPKAFTKAIDIECGRRSARQIAEEINRELFWGGPEVEICLDAAGRRYLLKSHQEDHNDSLANRIDENSIIVVSGGARGVTAKALIKLAQVAKPRLVLLGRTKLEDEPECCQGAESDAKIKGALLAAAKARGEMVSPKALGKTARSILAIREIKDNLKAMENAGSKVRYVAVDVLDQPRLHAELQQIREKWGPITGIVHGAGILADKLITQKTMDQFDAVFNTKVKGLESLLSATAKDPLTIICLFSSIAGRTGNMGQSDYAMANEVLNKVAGAQAFQRNDDCVVKSINWGPWDGGMVSSLLKNHFKEMGIALIPLDIGTSCFVREIMDSTSKHVEVVVGPRPPDGVLSIKPIEKTINLDLRVNKEKYPFIDSHRIKDVPVVPMALVLEWFSKAAELHSPELNLIVCKNLKFYRGITLTDFTKANHDLSVLCRQNTNGHMPRLLSLILPAPNGGSFYSAEMEMSSNGREDSKIMRSNKNGLPGWKWNVAEIYQNILFHGPEFRVIRSLEGVSEAKATCFLHGIDEMSWPDMHWVNDVAALDGGLQLAILWGEHFINKRSLPTAIGAYHRYQTGPITGPIFCELEGKLLDKDRTISDISFFNREGMLAAKLMDVQMHMLV